jgi:hypothetical protein
LKAENLLVEFESKSIKSIKIIDLGSAFYYDQLTSDMQLSTPEYLPPEALDFLENKMKVQS